MTPAVHSPTEYTRGEGFVSSLADGREACARTDANGAARPHEHANSGHTTGGGTALARSRRPTRDPARARSLWRSP